MTVYDTTDDGVHVLQRGRSAQRSLQAGLDLSTISMVKHEQRFDATLYMTLDSLARPTEPTNQPNHNQVMEELKTLPEYLKATNADGTAVLEATASWCSQCKAIAPFVEELRKKFPDARFYTYDTDVAGDIAQELGANQMPTVSFIKAVSVEMELLKHCC